MDELLETLDVDGRQAGLIARGTVHRLGLWHRAANVLLFDGEGRLLIQRRSSSKDVLPGAWDLSVAEHLQPGEDYEAAAIRGLREELGIAVESLEPLSAVIESKLEIPERGIRDYELQCTFGCIWHGPLSPDAAEVEQVRWIALSTLKAEFAESPERFTPWFRQRAEDIGLFSQSRFR